VDTNEEITTPEGSDGATSSPDTVDNVTQPVESEEGVSDANQEDTGEGTLLAGKYKNVEELEKAYQESQKAMGQLSQKAGLVNQLEQTTGMTSQQIAEALANQEQQRMNQAIQDNPGLAAFQEVQSLKSQLALQQEEKELDKFLTSEEGKPYASQRDKIFKLGLNLEKDKTYAEIAKEYFGETRAQGQQDAYKKIEQKIGTQATGASQAAPKGRVSIEDMKGMSSKEMESFLPWADISNRP
jgi:hypothetical protein